MVLDLAIDDRVTLTSSLDMAMQEIDMLFNTKCTELIGDTNYGMNFENFLWDFTVNDEEIENYIRRKIEQYTIFARNYSYTVNIKEVPGEQRDIFYITIEFKVPDEPIELSGNMDEDQMPRNKRVYMVR